MNQFLKQAIEESHLSKRKKVKVKEKTNKIKFISLQRFRRISQLYNR